MKCTSCGGRLDGPLTFCPFCGVRADVDLRQLHFRDLGEDATFLCPECPAPLHVIEFDTTPALRIERCTSCHGMLFNPGELEAALEAQSHPLVWLDSPQIHQIAQDFEQERQVVYRPCPVCRERMGHLNFGGRSGVILDRCPTHGVWVRGSQLRRLTEWWRAGGKLIFQNHEAERARRKFALPEGARRPKIRGTIESPPHVGGAGWPIDPIPDTAAFMLDVIIEAVVTMVTD